LFDLIGGTSTGGILASLLGARCLTAIEVERIYHRLVSRVFITGPSTKEQILAPALSEGWQILTNMLSTGAR
jgi:patatin-like phospholipase/acyl hydrolase